MFSHHSKRKQTRKSVISSAVEGSVYTVYDTNSNNYDPNWENNVLLIKGDGTHNGVNTTFVDDSGTGKSVTRNGDVTQGTFNPFAVDKNTGWSATANGGSAYFDGTTDYLTCGGGADFTFGTGDFTIEAWIYRVSGTFNLIDFNNGVLNLYAPAASGFRLWTTTDVITGSTVILDNTWYHVALCRSSNSTRLFVNGVQEGSTYSDNNSYSPAASGPAIGANVNGSTSTTGYISNLHIIKGTAKYTSNFTKPSAPVTAHANTKLLLNFNNANIKDETGKHNLAIYNDVKVNGTTKKYGTGSLYFDGTSDYILLDGSNDFAFGSSDFTLEMWINFAVVQDTSFIDTRGTEASAFVCVLGTSKFGFYQNTSVRINGTTTVQANTWYHYAICRANGVTRLFVNGVQEGISYTDGAVYASAANTPIIGKHTSGGQNLNGYIDDLRITKGKARYVNNFTPPSISLPTKYVPYPISVPDSNPFFPLQPSALNLADYDTDFSSNSLLIHGEGSNNQTNAVFLDSSGYNKTVTRNGDVTQGTKNPFTVDPNTGWSAITNGGSAYFDGTTDYLTLDGSSDFAFGTGDFTVEMWFMTGATAATLFDTRPTTTNSLNYFTLDIETNYVRLLVNGSNAIIGNTSVINNSWHHLALCRVAGVSKLFLNGSQVGNNYTDINNYLSATNRPVIGADGYSLGRLLTGYISNLNVIKGAAKYTTNFSVPTAPVTAMAPVAETTRIGDYSLLLQGEGTNNQTNTTFLDSSGLNKAITRNGDVAQGTKNPFAVDPVTGWSNVNNGGSAYFDGNGDYLVLTNHADWDFSTGDFTVECWYYVGAATFGTIFGNNGAAGFCALEVNNRNNGGFQISMSSNGSSWNISNGVGIDGTGINTWNHLAVSRSGTNTYLFLNGVLGATVTNSGSLSTTANTTFGLGARQNGTMPFTGYISNFNVIKGTAKYTTSFSVPTAPVTAHANTKLLLNFSNAGIVDSSGKNVVTVLGDSKISTTQFKYGSSSMYFDGTVDALRVTGSDVTFGTGNFTVEGWFYSTTTSNVSIFGTGYNTYPANNSFWLNINAGGTGYMQLGTNGAGWVTVSSNVFAANTWNHVAVTRAGTSLRLYLNGAQIGTTATNSADLSHTVLDVGGGFAAGFTGYVDDFRVLKGTARYTEDFTPAQIGALVFKRTRLLLNFNNAGIKDSTGKHDITIVNDAKISTTQYKYGSSSMYFDGTGDYVITSASSADFNLSSGDFTIEGWFYLSSNNASTRLFSIEGSTFSCAVTRADAGTGDNTKLQFGKIGTANYITGTTGSIPVSSWTHVALVRSGSTITMYSNGVSVGTTTTIPFENSNCKLTLAATAMFFAVSDYQGHIDDFRITKGVARYTSAFTPPSRSLPDYTTPLPAGPNTDNYWFPTSTLLKGDGTDNGTSFTDSTGKHTWTATNAVTKTGVKKFGTASMYFSGTNSYLAGDGSSDFAFGTTDFTIEMWIYRTATGVRQGLFDTRPASTDGAYVCFEVSATDKLNLYVGSSSPITATTTLAANTWYHVAICRASNNTRLFVNGVQDGATYSDSNTYGCGASRPAIGVHAYAMNAFLYTGYIDNLRVTKGFARYTANFAPPWYEFSTTQTPTSSYDDYWNNVTALIHSDTRADGLVVDHKTGAPWVKNGGVTLSNTQSKYGGYSCYFDGNGDYLTGDGSNNYDFPGDFTIEMWAYRTVAGVQQVLYDSRPTSSNGVYIYLDINSDKFRFHTDSGGTVVNTTTTLSANTWYHLSISRTGTTTRLFVNGISEGSLTSDSRSYLVGANRPSIGIDGNNGTVPFSGYIDELRITKGVGRYTTNFVPHTQAHYDLGFTEPNYNTNWDDVILLLQGSYLEVTTNLRDSSKKLVGLTNTSNYVVASTTQKKWGTHSLYLSGAVDHALKYTGLDALGSSSFTLEFWIYPALTGGGTVPVIMMLGQGSGVANASLVILLTNAGSLSVTLQGAGGYNWAHPTTVTANTWHHIAVTRNGTSFVLYLDGVGASYTAVESFVFDNMANNTIGTNLGSATYHRMSQCYIDDFRITKNVLRYGSNFILPSVEFESLVANDFPTSFYNQYWDETKLLLQGDYVGSNTAIIQDNSKYGFNPAPVNGAVVSNTQAKWGTHSLYFDGTGDGLNCSLDSSLVINGDYTIESWVYQSSSSGVQILICWNTNATNYATAYLYTNGGALTFHASNDGSSWGINAVSMGVTLTTNRWYHVALTRNGSSIKCWIDGVQLWSGTLSGGVTSGITKNCIGIYPDNSSYGWNGYMDDFRITKGVARYTQNFIPPTAAFTNQNTFTADPYFTSTTLLVHADGSDNQNNNTIVDSSAGNKTVTRNGTVAQGTYSPFPVASGSEYSASVNGGSAYFNGSGDYLTLDGSADFAFGDGDFTIEAWVRFGATNRHQLLLSTAGATTAFTMFALKDETDQVAWGGAGGTTVGTTVLSANVWYHIAAVRSSGVVKMYLNGSQELSVADNNSYTTAANLPQVGAQSGLYTFQGHISNLNIIKGTAKYTATFTVPTAPVAAHANTKLLLNFTNAAIRDETAKHIIKVSGDTKTMVAVNKYGNSSMYFDGSGDYLTLDGSADFAFGSGDWTIEMWVYKTANGLAGGLMGTSNDASLTNQFAWYINSGTPTLYFTYSGGSVGYTTSVPTAQWVHLAVCKSGTYIRQFINGIVDGNVATNDNTSFTVDPNRVIIGAIDNGSNPFAGYIDDVRITKGVARYVGNFVPPTAAFLNK